MGNDGIRQGAEPIGAVGGAAPRSGPRAGRAAERSSPRARGRRASAPARRRGGTRASPRPRPRTSVVVEHVTLPEEPAERHHVPAERLVRSGPAASATSMRVSNVPWVRRLGRRPACRGPAGTSSGTSFFARASASHWARPTSASARNGDEDARARRRVGRDELGCEWSSMRHAGPSRQRQRERQPVANGSAASAASRRGGRRRRSWSRASRRGTPGGDPLDAGRPTSAASTRHHAQSRPRRWPSETAASRSDARQPLGVRRVAAANDVEEARLDLLRDRADRTLADGAVVDLAHRRHLGGGAGEEHLVGQPELVARDARPPRPGRPSRARA